MKSNFGLVVFITLTAMVLTGCSHGKDFDVPEPGEIPKGPGVFTKGDDGAVLYDSKGGGLIAPPAPVVAATPVKNDAAKPSGTDFEAYDAYQKWKAWKQDPQNAQEYKEFNEWLEWKQYQQWKRNQQPQP